MWWSDAAQGLRTWPEAPRGGLIDPGVSSLRRVNLDPTPGVTLEVQHRVGTPGRWSTGTPSAGAGVFAAIGRPRPGRVALSRNEVGGYSRPASSIALPVAPTGARTGGRGGPPAANGPWRFAIFALDTVPYERARMQHAGELRSEAERCRRLATAVGDPSLAARLSSLAEELDEEAAALEAGRGSDASQSSRGPA